jgi:hypothetical protein
VINVLKKRSFSVKGVGNYVVEVHSDYTIVLYSTNLYLDEALYERMVGTDRVETSPRAALRVFREVEKFLIEFIHEKNPPYLRYDTGGDETRKPLYARLAKKFEKHGYHPVDLGLKESFLLIKNR